MKRGYVFGGEKELREMRQDGLETLMEALSSLNWNINDLIAATTIWVNPECYRFHLARFGSGIYYENTRRIRKGEKRGQIVDGIRIDDNTYANTAIKQAIGGRENLVNYSTCHIYDSSCYDPRFHTELANLVLIPSPISSLSDFFESTKQTLKYRSFELYGFYIDKVPEKPSDYPVNWRGQEPFDENIKRKLLRKTANIVQGTKQ